MSPASLGDLLAEAEEATARLIMARPALSTLAATWPSYCVAAERALAACLGVRAPNEPSDVVLSRAVAAAAAARSGLVPGAQRPSGNDLARAGELLSAAADLIATKPSLDPAVAREAGMRVAAIVAASSHAVVVADRTRAQEGIALRAMRLERVAARAVGHLVPSTPLEAPVAAPGSNWNSAVSVAEQYQAAALAWRRIAAQDFNPSNHALQFGAFSIAHVATDLRFVLNELGIRGEIDGQLRESQERWDAVGQAWRRISTASPISVEGRAAAQELRSNSDALRSAVRAAKSDHRQDAVEDFLTGAARGHRYMTDLGREQLSITQRLGRAGRLYVAALDLPPDEDRVEAMLRRHHVPALSERVATLTAPYDAAVTQSTRALAAVDQALATRQVSGRPPRLDELTDLAIRGPHQSRRR